MRPSARLFGGYWYLIGFAVVAMLGGAVAAIDPLVAVGVIACSVILAFTVRRPTSLVALLFVLGLLIMRPTWLGQVLTPVGVVLVAICAGVCAIQDRSTGRSIEPMCGIRSLVTWTLAASLWTLVLPVLHPDVPAWNLLKSAAYVSIAVVGASLVLRDIGRAHLIARIFIWICVITSVLYAVTLLLWLVDGSMSHEIARVKIPDGYQSPYPQPIYAPFTMTSGVSMVGSFPLPRLMGFMREPGLLQAALVWAFFAAGILKIRNRRLAQAALLLGLLGTQSTTGLAVLLATVVAGSVIGDAPRRSKAPVFRQFLGMALLVAGFYAALFAPVLGVGAKEEANPGSISDRRDNAVHGILEIDRHWLGGGYGPDVPANAGINLLASTTLVGAPGLALGLLALFRPMMLTRWRADAVKLVAPLAVTALVAQPVTGAPTFWLLLMLGLSLDARSRPTDSEGDDALAGPAGGATDLVPQATHGRHAPNEPAVPIGGPNA
jgi:hypothetical protein